MRVPIFYIPKTKFKKFFYIEKRYTSNRIIIPVGCDCHPAYSLQRLNLRKVSLPFDWLNINPVKSIEYVFENIETQFSLFLKDIEINDKGYFISKHYPYSEFMHEKYLNKNLEAVDKFNRRIKRFLSLIHENNISYLHNIPSDSIQNNEDLEIYLNSIKKFQTLLKPYDSIHIYLRFDENFNENHQMMQVLETELKKLKINTTKYLRNLERNGVWGDKRDYTRLYENLNIKLKMIFPRFYIK